MKPTEIRALSDAELLAELENAQQKLFNLHFQRVTQNLESTAELRKTRCDIARMRTIFAERQRNKPPAPEPQAEQPKEAAKT